ncbi:hypothetical protein [Acidisphaera sp. L21]|nr:hypothetical protein [Acidisphaera sp. L21]
MIDVKWLVVLLLLAGCADGGDNEPGSAHVRLNGVYSAFGGITSTR